MNFRKAQFFVIGIFILVFTFVGGYAFGINGFIASAKSLPKVNISREVPPEKELDFALFWRVWDTLKASYYDKSKLNEGNMVYGAIKGMVAAAGDPYTVFLTPSENKVTQDDLQGNFDGVGIQIGYRENQLAVIAPLPNTPADIAGIQAGDLILGIKDKNSDEEISTQGMSLPQAVQKIRGPKGSIVTLVILREGENETRDIDVTRDTIDVPSVVLEYVGENQTVAHLKVLKFVAETKAEWQKAVFEINSKPEVQNIILDLRNNPGGYLQAAVDIAADFLPKNSVVVIEEKGNGDKFEYKSETAPNLSTKKVIILVNKGSASASEILAGALRDSRGFKVLGEISFGKGTVQEPLQMENGSGIHITVGKWLTPKGTWVHEKGLEPDIIVQDNKDTVEDEQLQEAIKVILS